MDGLSDRRYYSAAIANVRGHVGPVQLPGASIGSGTGNNGRLEIDGETGRGYREQWECYSLRVFNE